MDMVGHSSREVVVIDPGARCPELDAFNQMARAAVIPVSYHLPALSGMSSLNFCQLENIAGVIIMGSAASVHAGLAWQRALDPWIENCIREGVPTLGLCYGHQLVARILGGKIDLLSGPKLTGSRDVSLYTCPRLGISSCSGPMVVSHREVVVECPPAMEVWATSSAVEIDGIRHKTLPVWGLQPHPEATAEFCANQNISIENMDYSFGHQVIKSFLTFCRNKVESVNSRS